MIGVVADDITGANDIGIMFAKSHIEAYVYAYDDYSPKTVVDENKPGVIILDTNSRLDSPELAYNKVFEATNRLRESGARMFINKTCSVFRGNIGAEFDAMLDALDEKFAVVVLGFPKNGRTTVDGIHYVHGKRLEDSEFRSDPMHPMIHSRLVDILQAQTMRKVDNLDYRTIDLGPDRLREAVAAKKLSCNYLILDVKDQDALITIAAAVNNESIICGSSALAEELARSLDTEYPIDRKLNLQKIEGVGILCAAGSLMPQTYAQIQYMKEQGVRMFILDSLKVLDESNRQDEINQLVDVITDHLLGGSHAVLHTTNNSSIVDETKIRGTKLGLTAIDVSRLVSDSMAEVTTKVMERSGQNRLVVAGGETSAAICHRMGIKGLRVWKEIEPGLPSCVTLDRSPMLLVLKSGSFGSKEFLLSALKHLLDQ